MGLKKGSLRQRWLQTQTVSFSRGLLAMSRKLLGKDKQVVCKSTSKTSTNTADRSSKQQQVLLSLRSVCQLSGMSKRRFKGLLGKRGRKLCGKSFDIPFLTDYLSMGNNEEIFTST